MTMNNRAKTGKVSSLNELERLAAGSKKPGTKTSESFPGKPGEKFKNCEKEMEKRKNVDDPAALCAWIGREHGKIKAGDTLAELERLASPTKVWIMSPDAIINRAVMNELISPAEAKSKAVVDAAQEIAEDLRSSWSENEGFGSSDGSEAVRRMLNKAGIKVDFRGNRLVRLAGYSFAIEYAWFLFAGNVPFNIDVIDAINRQPISFKDDDGDRREDLAMKIMEYKSSPAMTFVQEKTMMRETMVYVSFPKGAEKEVTQALKAIGKKFKFRAVEAQLAFRAPVNVPKKASIKVGFEHKSQQDLDKYLKEHPGADKSLHWVSKDNERGYQSDPGPRKTDTYSKSKGYAFKDHKELADFIDNNSATRGLFGPKTMEGLAEGKMPTQQTLHGMISMTQSYGEREMIDPDKAKGAVKMLTDLLNKREKYDLKKSQEAKKTAASGLPGDPPGSQTEDFEPPHTLPAPTAQDEHTSTLEALGNGKYALQDLLADQWGATVADHERCQDGSHWSESHQKCVPKGTPPAWYEKAKKPESYHDQEGRSEGQEGRYQFAGGGDKTASPVADQIITKLMPELNEYAEMGPVSAGPREIAVQVIDDAILGKTAAVQGLYGFPKGVQTACEGSINRLKKVANKLARKAWQKDEQVAPFLQAHARKANSAPAKILVEAMKGLGPQIKDAADEGDKGSEEKEASQILTAALIAMDQEIKTAARYGLYGHSSKTTNLGLTACTTLREAAGDIVGGMNNRMAHRHADITGFFSKHSSEGKCAYSELLGSCYPDSEFRQASSKTSAAITEKPIRIKAKYPNGSDVVFNSNVPSDFDGTDEEWARMQCEHKGLTYVAMAQKGKQFEASEADYLSWDKSAAVHYYALVDSQEKAESFESKLSALDVGNVYTNKVQGQFEVHFEPSDSSTLKEAKAAAASLGLKIVKD